MTITTSSKLQPEIPVAACFFIISVYLFSMEMLHAILILDEPTASLDVIAENEVFMKFQEMSSSKLCIMVTHRFVNTRQVDNIIVLESGQMMEFGSHAELMQEDGVYARLYRLQADSYENVKNNKIHEMVTG